MNDLVQQPTKNTAQYNSSIVVWIIQRLSGICRNAYKSIDLTRYEPMYNRGSEKQW